MLLMEVVVVCCANHTKPINVPCAEVQIFLMFITVVCILNFGLYRDEFRNIKLSYCNVNLKIAQRTPASQNRPCKLKLVRAADLLTDSDHVCRNGAWVSLLPPSG
jgi:hypothetical protein